LLFIDQCRRKKDKEVMNIITLCRQENTETAIQALKRGADDFLAWPFSIEEFYSRVNNRIETLALFSELRTITRTDFLTGIFNRGHLMSLISREHQRSKRYNRPLSIVMLDADKFKNINDTYGHATGDLVLIRLAQIVKEVIRSEDCFGRFGGEEFVCALPETDMNAAMHVAERIRTLMEQAVIATDDGDVRFTVSFGVSTQCAENNCANMDTLLKQADEALYRAKETGRNRIVHYLRIADEQPETQPSSTS
jgi:diguanylate cyclase (GGDEF)-like protein